MGQSTRTNHLLLQVNTIPVSLFWKKETGIRARPVILQALKAPSKTQNKIHMEKDFCFAQAKTPVPTWTPEIPV